MGRKHVNKATGCLVVPSTNIFLLYTSIAIDLIVFCGFIIQGIKWSNTYAGHWTPSGWRQEQKSRRC